MLGFAFFLLVSSRVLPSKQHNVSFFYHDWKLLPVSIDGVYSGKNDIYNTWDHVCTSKLATIGNHNDLEWGKVQNVLVQLNKVHYKVCCRYSELKRTTELNGKPVAQHVS